MSKGATTRRIRRRAAQFRAFKNEALALQAGVTVEKALGLAAERGMGAAEVRARIVSQLGECRRNLASRKREVRLLPHMRGYHTRYALGELAIIKMGTKMLAELSA